MEAVWVSGRDFWGSAHAQYSSQESLITKSARSTQVSRLPPKPAQLIAAINLFPNPLPSDLKDHSTYPALTTAVRDLASDNIMTAVMLTGVMLLQVSSAASSSPLVS